MAHGPWLLNHGDTQCFAILVSPILFPHVQFALDPSIKSQHDKALDWVVWPQTFRQRPRNEISAAKSFRLFSLLALEELAKCLNNLNIYYDLYYVCSK